MMFDMVERVARAIYEAARAPQEGIPWEMAEQEEAIREARAAIDTTKIALKEHLATLEEVFGPAKSAEHVTERIWHAFYTGPQFYDAALAEGTEAPQVDG